LAHHEIRDRASPVRRPLRIGAAAAGNTFVQIAHFIELLVSPAHLQGRGQEMARLSIIRA
jgi:hypothetical protein